MAERICHSGALQAIQVAITCESLANHFTEPELRNADSSRSLCHYSTFIFATFIFA